METAYDNQDEDAELRGEDHDLEADELVDGEIDADGGNVHDRTVGHEAKE